MIPEALAANIADATADAQTSYRLTHPWTCGWSFGVGPDGDRRSFDPAQDDLRPNLSANSAVEALCVAFPAARLGVALALFGTYSGREIAWEPGDPKAVDRHLVCEPAWLVLVNDGVTAHPSDRDPSGKFRDLPAVLQQFTVAVVADLDRQLIAGVSQEAFPITQ